MDIEARVRLKYRDRDKDAVGAFGLGVVMLLEGVEQERSLNRAAKRIGMAYSKAWRVIREAEGQLGYELLIRDGARGSTLNEEGRRALETYRSIEAEVRAIVERRKGEFGWR